MDKNLIAFGLTLIGTVCWAVCFWWMHRISTNQNDLLEKLCEQSKRIEKLSKAEHDLIKEVHPQVHEIKEGVQEMVATAKENQQNNRSVSKDR
jgi:UDP-N-acetylglucosamine 2-epimerase